MVRVLGTKEGGSIVVAAAIAQGGKKRGWRRQNLASLANYKDDEKDKDEGDDF